MHPRTRSTLPLAIAAFLLAPIADAQAADARAAAARTASAIDDPVAGEPTMLCLRDGTIHWGDIQAHDSEGITFARIEDGGVSRIPYRLLDPEYALELRRKHGYLDLTAEELLIDADRIPLVDGTEIVGRIVDRTPDAVVVKRSGSTLPIPKNRIAGASTTTQVPALQIYTKAELYQSELAKSDDKSAASQFALGRYCERILDYAHAAEHYKHALDLDPQFRAKEVAPALARASDKAKAQGEIDYLADVDLLTARGAYDEALARLAAFPEKFAGSPLASDAKKKSERVVAARERDLSERVERLWPTIAGRLARDAAKLGLDEVLAYLDGKIRKDIADGVAKDARRVSKDVTPEVVKKHWSSRKKVRWYRASYGAGTWLLGREAALRGTDAVKEAPKDKGGEKDQERAELEARIKRFLDNQEIARKSKSSAEQKEDGEKFWRELTPGARAQWILAYYVEHSGDMDVQPKPVMAACRECGGQGTRIVSVAGANVARTMVGKGVTEQAVECPGCHGLGVVRRILYR